MSKKHTETSRKSARSVEGTYIDEVHVPTLNILTQTHPPKRAEISATCGSSRLKDKKEKKMKQRKGRFRQIKRGRRGRGKLSKHLLNLILILLVKQKRKNNNVEVAQSSKPSTRKRFQQFLEQTPFGVFYDIHHIKIQCQLLRHLMILKSENVRHDMLIVKINGTELCFGIKEFAAITDLKCGLFTDFFQIHRLKIGILYFITSFLTGSEASKITIPKLYFDLVESGQYVNFPWSNECFRSTLKACSRRLGKNATSFKFSQFHIALQVWFYECCHPFDNTVAIRVSNVTPRILNWKTSNESIFFDDLKNTIFRTHGNQHKFRNIVLTDEELNVMDQINLHQSSSHHETEDQATSERHNVDFDEKYVELKKKITEDDPRQHVEEYEKALMDQPSVSMREYVHTSNTDDEAQKSNDQTIGVVFNADITGSSNSKPTTLDDYPNFTMTQIVALDPILNANTTPDVQPRNRNPGKYDISPYIRLSEGKSSSRRVPILFRIKHLFESHNGFEVATELIDKFNKWVFKDVSSRRDMKSVYSKLKDNFQPQMDFGVVKVA
ncbi:hypothetical protein H5410_034148 [Solanum commersonii]|uniref:Ulp1 protease family, C-terminal catalytic domain containing protein n=1 Tax=Solanum commersonii TaxID=4109 RepID=A0A9J5YQR7_SOLCO|nr:hypothetical protein H5410_034148 [Solanum commersonii]